MTWQDFSKSKPPPRIPGLAKLLALRDRYLSEIAWRTKAMESLQHQLEGVDAAIQAVADCEPGAEGEDQ